MTAVLDSAALRQAIRASVEDLRAARAAINDANVYPVADSDTGTNLVGTFEAVDAALARGPQTEAGVAHALRSGSLMGARGNSGVIMAQILRGLADALDDGLADVSKIAKAFNRSCELAYEAVLEPAEGTILTVIRSAAEAAQEPHANVAGQFAAAGRAAAAALARTPDQMPLLKEAGVVDAGGMGLVIVLRAFARALGAPIDEPLAEGSERRAGQSPLQCEDASLVYAHEVQYLLRAPKERITPLRALLATIGDSVAVTGDNDLWRVHVHTNERGRAIAMGEAVGDVSDVEVVSFAEQIAEQAARAPNAQPEQQQSERTMPKTPGVRGIDLARAEMPSSLVAVTAGEGTAKLFGDLGAITIDGGERMDVPVERLQEAAAGAPGQHVFILPNNEELFARAHELTQANGKKVTVLRTGDLAEGLAVAIAFGDARDPEGNLTDMVAAMTRTRSGQVVVARQNGETLAGPVKQGQAVGFAHGSPVEIADDPITAAVAVAADLAKDREVLTVLCGAGVEEAERARLADSIRAAVPGVQVEILDGGQPVHRYLMAAE